jgi:hypothetical protein
VLQEGAANWFETRRLAFDKVLWGPVKYGGNMIGYVTALLMHHMHQLKMMFSDELV